MKIEVGDVIKTLTRRREVLKVTNGSVFACDVECRWAGEEIYRLSAVLGLCYTKVWSLEKATKQLDMSALEEL